MTFPDVVGFVGIACFLGAYFLLQNGTWAATNLRYLLCNLAGALLIMFSLIFDWNLSAFLLEAVWALITLYGIFKALRKQKA